MKATVVDAVGARNADAQQANSGTKNFVFEQAFGSLVKRSCLFYTCSLSPR